MFAQIFSRKFTSHIWTTRRAKDLKNINGDSPRRHETLHIFLPDFFLHHQNKKGVNRAEIIMVFCLSWRDKFCDINRNNKDTQRLKNNMMVSKKSSGKIMGARIFFKGISLDSHNPLNKAARTIKIIMMTRLKIIFCTIDWPGIWQISLPKMVIRLI